MASGRQAESEARIKEKSLRGCEVLSGRKVLSSRKELSGREELSLPLRAERRRVVALHAGREGSEEGQLYSGHSDRGSDGKNRGARAFV